MLFSLSLAINGADELKTWFLAEGLVAPLLKLAKSDEVTTRKKSIKIIAQLVLNGTVELPVPSRSNVAVGVAHLIFHAAKKQTRWRTACSRKRICCLICSSRRTLKFSCTPP